MASIGSDPNGRKRILFTAPDGRRKTVRLGKVSHANANTAREMVEALLSAAVTGGTVKPHVTAWVDGLDDVLRARLAAVGLVSRQRYGSTSLSLLFDEFFAAMKVKPGTKRTNEQTRDCLYEFFKPTRNVRDIDNLDAEKWRQWMAEPAPKGKGLAIATISKRVKTARRAFAKAVRWGMISANPFDDVKAGPQDNRENAFFIDRATAQKVLDACPSAQWRLIFALSRFGGLRCPSEHLLLKWADVDWDEYKGRIRVTSPKTEHYHGGGQRYVPLFPELRRYLEEVYELAEEGGPQWVITDYRLANVNLRSQLERILAKAGVEPWPRLFHNLRASRQTELEEHYPSHVVCGWLGNSERIAKKHYLQTLDSHFEKAVGEGDSKNPSSAAHNPAQSISEQTGKDGKPVGVTPPIPAQIPMFAQVCPPMPIASMTPTGFEPVSRP